MTRSLEGDFSRQLMATPPRPGSLLDAMRARGTLRAAGDEGSNRQAIAPNVVALAEVSDGRRRLTPPLVLCSSPVSKVSAIDSPIAGSPGKGCGIVRTPSNGAESVTPKKKKIKRPPVPKFPAVNVLLESPSQNQQAPDSCQQFRQLRLKSPKKAEDNYEISDGEDSSDEALDRREHERNRKHIPEWSVDYSGALDAQAVVDPDSIFGARVPLCDLDLIFPDHLYVARGKVQPKRRRGSSAQWQRDCLRQNEVAKYRQKMGHLRRWSALRLRQSIAKGIAKTLRSTVGEKENR